MPTFLNLDTYRNETINEYNFSPSYSNSTDSSVEPYIMSSPTSSSMSPMSTSSDNSQTTPNNFSLLTIGSNNDMSMETQTILPTTQKYDLQGNVLNPNEPYLAILEHPIEKFRFRYKSEMHGTHGSLMGQHSQKSKKTFPTVELRNYKGEAIIRCSLYQTDTLKRTQHSHRLVVRNGDVDHDDPHDVVVSTETGFTAVFQGMGIIHTAKKYIVEELFKKKILEKQVELGRTLSSRDEAQIKNKSEIEAKTMNLNQVCLCFQAFIVENNMWRKLCDPIYSNPVNNMKSALTGELKISRLSAAVTSAAGGDDLIILVEKVGKKNIKVRFFELDDEDREVWEAWGIFTEVDVHHQYAIALRTPPYKNQDITEPVDVFIQLYRPTDHDRSEPMPFKYKPRNYLTSRKRPRISSSFNSNELIPTVVRGLTNSNSNSGERERDTISSEYNLSGILKELGSELPDINLSSNDFDSYYKNNVDEYQKNIAIKSLQTDGSSGGGPTSVIKRGPTAPPIKQTPNFEDIFRQIISDYRFYGHKEIPVAKEKIMKLIKDSIINGEYILHWAIRNENKFKIISTLFQLIDKLEMEELLQLKKIGNETCLHVACVHNKPEYIRPLINLGADPNIQDVKGNTPLHISVELNFIMCASKLLEKSNYTTPKSKELRIDLANDNGQTALHLAVRKNSLNMTRKLLENNASIKLSESKHGYNVLHIAVEQKSEEIVKYLLENTSINVNDTNNSNYTPLHLAVALDDIKSKSIVKLLLKYNADPTLLNGTNFNKIVGIDNDDSENDDGSDSELDNEVDDSTSNKPEILQILNKYSQRNSEGDESNLEIDEETASMNTNDELDDTIGVKFDDICVEELTKILSKTQGWRNLAISLGFQGEIKLWESSNNPTKMLLKFIESENITLTKLVGVLQNMFQANAVNAIDEMIARHMENDD